MGKRLFIDEKVTITEKYSDLPPPYKSVVLHVNRASNSTIFSFSLIA